MSEKAIWEYLKTLDIGDSRGDAYVENLYIDIDSTTSSGTDYDIRTALSSLGWSSVISSNKLNVKQLLAYLLGSLTLRVFNVKSQITAATGVTIGSAYLYVYGNRVAQLYVSATFSSNQSSGTSYDIGTLADAIKPRNLTPFPSTYGGGQINAGGGMSFRPQVNLNGNTERYFSAVYLLNSSY